MKLRLENKAILDAFWGYRNHMVSTIALFNFDPKIPEIQKTYGDFEAAFTAQMATATGGYYDTFLAECKALFAMRFYSFNMMSMKGGSGAASLEFSGESYDPVKV